MPYVKYWYSCEYRLFPSVIRKSQGLEKSFRYTCLRLESFIVFFMRLQKVYINYALTVFLVVERLQVRRQTLDDIQTFESETE
jgi:hypothetical protein